MTPEQLKTLVAAKIAGQGTNVDAGGGLAEILNGIIDIIGEPTGNPVVVVRGRFVNEANAYFSLGDEYLTAENAFGANKIVIIDHADGKGYIVGSGGGTIQPLLYAVAPNGVIVPARI